MIKFNNTKKTYESPYLTITEFVANDIIMASGVSSLITAEGLLGKGTIGFNEMEIDLK